MYIYIYAYLCTHTLHIITQSSGVLYIHNHNQSYTQRDIYIYVYIYICIYIYITNIILHISFLDISVLQESFHLAVHLLAPGQPRIHRGPIKQSRTRDRKWTVVLVHCGILWHILAHFGID